MLEFIKTSIAGFPPFIIYFAISALMLALFTFI